MATEPKPDLPSADECVRKAWQAAQEAQSRGLPMSSQAAWWQESQAWSLLALAQGRSGPAVIQSVPQPPTPAPVARRKPGPKPKSGETPDDMVARLKAEWEQDS